MKIAYFLRGLGIGILFCALVLFVAYRTTPDTITDEEVIERAKELGMVEAGDNDSSLDALFTQEESTTEDADTEEATKEEATTEEATTEEATTEEATTEEATTEEATTEEAATEETQTVSFTISAGMYSEKVSATLAALGVISDADAFNQYLNDNGYASRLVTGTYQVTKGEDYASIASKITGAR